MSVVGLNLLIFLFFIVGLLHGSLGVDWCSNDLQCDGKKNTMCSYSPQKNTGSCKGIKNNQTPGGRKMMLELHNAYRNKLAAGDMKNWMPAANMRQMSWDCEIESVALRWAMQCVAGHDKCRRTTKFKSVGQNYGMGGSTENYPSSNGSFTGWVDEISMISDPGSMMNSFVAGAWGHFTQVVWAESYKLGCGEVHYEDGGFMRTVVVCNYGPGGNVLKQKMYESGKPASKCPNGISPSQEYPNLCSASDDDAQSVECSTAMLFRPEISVMVSATLLLLW